MFSNDSSDGPTFSHDDGMNIWLVNPMHPHWPNIDSLNWAQRGPNMGKQAWSNVVVYK